MERFCVKYVRSVNEKCGIFQGFIHCIHTLSRTPGAQSGSVLRGWILVAEQAVGRLVLLDFWEAADWGIEAVIRIVVVALADLAQQNSAGTGFDLEIMIHVLLDMDALTRRELHLRSSRHGIGSAVAVDGHIGFAVDGFIG